MIVMVDGVVAIAAAELVDGMMMMLIAGRGEDALYEW